MPIYEYICGDCEHAFETLVTGDERPSCPTCEGTRLEKQLSTFAPRGESRSELPVPGSCGTCGDPRGPGACN